MSRFSRFNGPPTMTSGGSIVKSSGKGIRFIDYKDVENLRRSMSPNGKIYGRKRMGLTAQEQKMLATAIKRARFLGLLPFTSATL